MSDAWMKLEWSESRRPNDECYYDHCVAETPFGRFQITWKSWKERPCPSIDKTPWDDWGGCYDTLPDAKEAAQEQFEAKLAECQEATQ